MPDLYGFTPTTAGLELMASLLAGQTLTITRAMVGSGKPDSLEAMAGLTDLVAPVARATSTEPIRTDDAVTLTVEYRSDLNGGLQEGFYINEYGIFAKTADSAETLIFYGCLGDHPQWVSPYSPGVAPDVRDFPATIRISSEVQVRIDYHADAFITAEEAADLLRSMVEKSGGGFFLMTEEIPVAQRRPNSMYSFERSVDGGGWTVFATTSALTRTDPIDDSWTTVAYRAKATDNLGLSGPYATSQTYTVVHNLPPTAPGSIAVTGVVRGENAAITLTAATDPDGTVASYIFERQVDGGAWQQVAQVNSLTQTDTVGEDWGTVAYRACAVDDLGLAGPCITGETYTVNSGWVTIGGPAEDMGSQPRRFDFAFSVSVSGVASVDAITVSVARDGTRIYSGTPSAGAKISVPVDARLLGAGEHVIEVQASKDDYLPASRRYTFTVPAVTIPDGGYGAISQASDGKTMFYTTLAQRCIGTDGVDIQAQVDALTARVKTLEG